MNDRTVNENLKPSAPFCPDCNRKYQQIESVLRSTSHELNNYLSVLDGNLHMAQKRAAPESKIAEVLKEAESASEKLGILVSKMRSCLVAEEQDSKPQQ